MKTLGAIAAETGSVLSDPASAELIIRGVSAISNAKLDSLVFIENVDSLPSAMVGKPGAIIAPLTTRAEGCNVPLLLTQNPRLTFARIAILLDVRKSAQGIHPTAVISHPEGLGRGISIGPHAVIGDANVGSGTLIENGCSIADGVRIGRDCILHPHVSIYPGTILGDRVIVHAGAVLGADGFGYVRDPASGAYLSFPQQGSLVIEDDVEIGANTTIDRGALEETRIGEGSKLDNLVHVGHNCRIGRNVVIASQTGISGSCVIGDGAILGGKIGLGDHVTIGEGVILGGGAGILPHKNLQGPNQVFWGTPAKPLKQYLRELATLSKISRQASKSREGR